MSTHALFLVRMDIAHDHEATFNDVYDREHAPNLRGVPGVRRAARYRQPSPKEHAAPRPSARSSTGNASTTSIARESSVSTTPR